MALVFTSTATSTAWATSVTPPLTFTAMSIGTASADRVVIATIGVDGNATNGVISGVTIGGVTATKRSFVDANANGFGTYIYEAAVPTGTTANVVISCNGFPSGIACALGIITGGASFSAQTTAAYAAVADPHGLTTTVPANGVGIFLTLVDRTTTPSYTNATGYANIDHSGNSASDLLAASTTNNSPSFTGANFFGLQKVAATWGVSAPTTIPNKSYQANYTIKRASYH